MIYDAASVPCISKTELTSRKKCEVSDCNVQPSYGTAGEFPPRFCVVFLNREQSEPRSPVPYELFARAEMYRRSCGCGTDSVRISPNVLPFRGDWLISVPLTNQPTPPPPPPRPPPRGSNTASGYTLLPCSPSQARPGHGSAPVTKRRATSA